MVVTPQDYDNLWLKESNSGTSYIYRKFIHIEDIPVTQRRRIYLDTFRFKMQDK